MRTRMLVAWALCLVVAAALVADDLERQFASPPNAAKPRVYWWWLNSRVSKEGITRDLEEYSAKGIGGVLLFDAGGEAGPLPSGPSFMSVEWRELFKHALGEADRLGIEVSVNLCSGWDAGGPWISLEQAAKCFVQSQLRVAGAQRFAGQLPQPPGNVAHYRDVVWQAFREPSGIHPSPAPRVTASSSQNAYPADNAADGSDESFWVSNGLQPGDAPTPQKPEWLRFDTHRSPKPGGETRSPAAAGRC
ncbi:MAG: glycosyl hydrolase [Pirellulaceae bacterium]